MLGQTFDEELRTRLAPLQEGLRAGIISLVDDKVMEEARKAVIKAAVIGSTVGLVVGILVAPTVRGFLGLKR